MCKILFNEEGDFHSGALILVDKPLKWTSFDVVNKIRWCLKSACGKIKVGHAGTLDPLATGLVLFVPESGRNGLKIIWLRKKNMWRRYVTGL